ncbi:hypothetical protein AC579_7201 [Pseudocercospora musae]|uniref:Uncharacterized protein n=1 Tax=Pseudocercospora musae TaxID=113226 RepID=A0A139HCC5_9PEZI|nr:hypothetical protein AC579_7201 [Pseudocercospora musae]
MVSTRSRGGKKSPKTPVKAQCSKVKKGKKAAAPKPKKPTKKKPNANKSSPSKGKRVSWEETETEYSDENDDIISPYAAGKHRSPTSYKAPKGSRRYSGNGKLVNNKGIYSGVRPKSSPGLGRKTSFGYDGEDSEEEPVGPAPATVHRNRGSSSPISPRMEMELKAAELLEDLMNLQVKFYEEGLQHSSFDMLSKHLGLTIEILTDMRRYPGSWPEGPDEISLLTWRNKILDVLEHIEDADPQDPKLKLYRDPLWPGVQALGYYDVTESRFKTTPQSPLAELRSPSFIPTYNSSYPGSKRPNTNTTPYSYSPPPTPEWDFY